PALVVLYHSPLLLQTAQHLHRKERMASRLQKQRITKRFSVAIWLGIEQGFHEGAPLALAEFDRAVAKVTLEFIHHRFQWVASAVSPQRYIRRPVDAHDEDAPACAMAA